MCHENLFTERKERTVEEIHIVGGIKHSSRQVIPQSSCSAQEQVVKTNA